MLMARTAAYERPAWTFFTNTTNLGQYHAQVGHNCQTRGSYWSESRTSQATFSRCSHSISPDFHTRQAVVWCWIGFLYSACHSRAFIPNIKQLLKVLLSCPHPPYTFSMLNVLVPSYPFLPVHQDIFAKDTALNGKSSPKITYNLSHII